MSSTPRFLGVSVVLGLTADLLVGVGLAQPSRAAATPPSAAPSLPSSGAERASPTP